MPMHKKKTPISQTIPVINSISIHSGIFTFTMHKYKLFLLVILFLTCCLSNNFVFFLSAVIFFSHLGYKNPSIISNGSTSQQYFHLRVWTYKTLQQACGPTLPSLRCENQIFCYYFVIISYQCFCVSDPQINQAAPESSFYS